MSKKNKPLIPKGYARVFEQLKADIQQTQLKAALSVTKELTMLYWRIGRALLKKSSKQEWGAKTLERLANDLLAEFPDIKGFSLRNLQYMRKFADSYPDENYAATAAQIPWGHNMLLLDKTNPKYIDEIVKITGFDPERTIKSLSSKEFEVFWKAIEQVENWEKGKEDFIDKCYISAVRKKHGVITEYLIKQNKISEWVSKKEALKLAEEGRLHAVVVHPKKRQAYLRPEFGSKSFEMA